MSTVDFGTPSGTEFSVSCKDGSYINNFYGAYDTYVEKLGATCSDGKDLGSVGTLPNLMGFGPNEKFIKASELTPSGPFAKFNVATDGQKITSFNNLKGHGVQQTKTCPSGAAVGISGTYDDKYITSLSIKCGAPSSYCYNHLEDPICKDADKGTLEIACGTSWTTTCDKRVKELNKAMIATHCTHSTSPICSCYVDAPSYIPAKLVDIPQCWSATCAEHGYIPNEINGACPAGVIGSDQLAGVNTKSLTSNIKIVPGGKPSANQSDNDTLTMIIIFIVIIAIVGGLAAVLFMYVKRKARKLKNKQFIQSQEETQDENEADSEPVESEADD